MKREKKGTEFSGIQKQVKIRSDRLFHSNGMRQVGKINEVNEEYYCFSNKDNLCDFLEKWPHLDKGLRAKERNKSQDSDMRTTVTEVASYQKPYFLSCGGLCSHPDREECLRNKETFYSKQCSQDLAVLIFAIKTLIRISTDDWQLIWVVVRKL